MEDLISLLGVPGIIAYMLVKDYFAFRRNGKPVSQPNHSRTKSGDVAYSITNERFDRLDRAIERQGDRMEAGLRRIETVLREQGRGS